MRNTSKQANNGESRISLPQLPWETCLENTFQDICDNKRNVNRKELLSLIEDYLLYNIVQPGKLNLFFTRTKSWLYLNYEFF